MLAVRVMQVRRSGAKVTFEHSTLAPMLAAHTRADSRTSSLSPPRAHSVPAPSSQAHPQYKGPATTDAVDGASMSVAAAVRDYERIQSELSCLARQSRQLRARLAKSKAALNEFMRERNLERISTKRGEIVVRFVERPNRVRPGRRAIEQCILPPARYSRILACPK
jgi:hypothetical protein